MKPRPGIVLFMAAALVFTGFTLGWTLARGHTIARWSATIRDGEANRKAAFSKGVGAGSAAALTVANETLRGNTNFLRDGMGEIYRRVYTNYPEYKP